MRNPCDSSYDVAALQFQAHSNYGTSSIGFAVDSWSLGRLLSKLSNRSDLRKWDSSQA